MTQQKLTPSISHFSLDKSQSICSSADDCFNAKQAAMAIGISSVTFSNWKKSGKIIPDHRHGKRNHYTSELIMSYQDTYRVSSYSSDELIDIDPIQDLSSRSLTGRGSIMLQTSADYNSEQLYPFKAEAKLLNVLIDSSADKPQLLFIFLGMLISLLIKLLILIDSNTHMMLTAYQLNEQYSEILNSQATRYSARGLPLEQSTQGTQAQASSQNREDKSSKLPSNKSNTDPVDDHHPSHKPKPGKTIQQQHGTTTKGSSRISLWQKAVISANQMFLRLSRLMHDSRLDDEEKERTKSIVANILRSYKRLTSYITRFEPGTARHDVPLLILTRKPKDFGINSHRWSVRALATACKQKKTKKASRATIGRITKELKWNFAIKPKMLSSDPEYGAILLHLGLVFNQLAKDDMVIFSDDFKYTSSKVAEYLKQQRLPAGMNTVPPFGIHKTYYKTKAAIRLTGLLCGNSRELLLKELEDGTFDGYYKTLVALLDELIAMKSDAGKIYLIIDNAPNR